MSRVTGPVSSRSHYRSIGDGGGRDDRSALDGICLPTVADPAAGYAVGGFWVEWLRVGPLPSALGLRYGALGDIVVFVLAVAGMYLTRPGRRPSARVHPRRVLAEDSSGDVMSM